MIVLGGPRPSLIRGSGNGHLDDLQMDGAAADAAQRPVVRLPPADDAHHHELAAALRTVGARGARALRAFAGVELRHGGSPPSFTDVASLASLAATPPPRGAVPARPRDACSDPYCSLRP